MSTTFTLFSFSVLVLSLLIYRYVSYVNISGLCQLDSRPVVYGEDLCSVLFSKNISITSGLFRLFINLLSPKTVLQASINNRYVILKTIVPPGDFKKIQDKFKFKFTDEVLRSKRALDIVKLHIHDSIRFKPGSVLNPKFRLCPYSGNIENLFRRWDAKKEHPLQNYLHLWTILQANPEPLVLKLLEPPIWPVPKFHGSCGRLIAVEDCGDILSDFYDAPWSVRANLTLQLLRSVVAFTFADPDFAFYLMDLSPDNMAVTDDGLLRFIDLEHLILLDRNPFYLEGEMEVWTYNHSSSHIPCKDCIVFDSDEICRHSISDHNIYAVCKEILSDSSIFPKGFLHARPYGAPALDKLDQLIAECVQGSMRPRFETANIIMAILDKYFHTKKLSIVSL